MLFTYLLIKYIERDSLTGLTFFNPYKINIKSIQLQFLKIWKIGREQCEYFLYDKIGNFVRKII